MTFHPQAFQLITFVALLAVIASLAWGVMAYPLKISPRASIRFCIANLLVVIGILLLSFRTEQPNYFYWLASDILILAGFILVRLGVQRLFKLANTTKYDFAQLLFFAAIMLSQQHDPTDNNILGIAFSISAAITLSLLTKDGFFAIKEEFDVTNAFILILPHLAMAIIFIFRAITLILLPETHATFVATHTVEAVPILWTFATLTLCLNISIFGAALTHLVAKIRLLADRDQLTNLWNRRAIMTKILAVHKSWRKHHIHYTIVMVDLDYFKSINDNYGHSAGDAALSQTASLMKNVMRESDEIGRFGGEEFLVLLPNTNMQSARHVVEKIRLAIEQSPLIWNGKHIALSASVGFSTVYEGGDPNVLIAKADEAMYRAKSLGRNQSCQAT
ncbi:GGDEF domain-containing protein [Colwelliaceae bacterium 6471]